MKSVLNRLGSIKLTLTVLLVLACAAALGTFLPRGGDMEAWRAMVGQTGARAAAALGFTDFYHSVWFSTLLALLVLNLLACTANRIPGMISTLSGKAALGREAVIDLPESGNSFNMVDQVLVSSGFRPRGKGTEQVYSRGSSGYLYTLLAHGSILIIMAFSMFGSAAGFIATQRVYVGDSTGSAFNWKIKADRPLPFELRVEGFTLEPHPVGVRLGIMEIRTQKKGRMITTHVGGTFEVPGVEGKVKLESFDGERKDFVASWTTAGGTRMEVRRDEELGDTGLSLVPIAFATWPERQATVNVSLVHGDARATSGEISVNRPMVSAGIRVYLTDYGKDRFGLPYVGFQFVHDPGQIGVWAGCILFLVCLPGTVFLRHSCAVMVRGEGRLRVHLSSRGNRDEVIDKLRERLASVGQNLDGGTGEA